MHSGLWGSGSLAFQYTQIQGNWEPCIKQGPAKPKLRQGFLNVSKSRKKLSKANYLRSYRPSFVCWTVWSPPPPQTFLSPPVRMHGGLICAHLCVCTVGSYASQSVCLSLTWPKFRLEKKSLDKKSYRRDMACLYVTWPKFRLESFNNLLKHVHCMFPYRLGRYFQWP